MARIIRGPFDLIWGDNVLEDVEEISVDFETSSDEFETVQGKTYELTGPQKVSVTLTLLASDLPALATVLPQYFVPNGGTMSTGETVNNANGAIDVAAIDCEGEVFDNLDIRSCANPANILRIVNCRTELDGIEVDNKVQKVSVKFLGQSAQGEASVQFFKEGTINVVS